jgi:pimeloyl-ACP methyl ester carboxylesterase
MKWITLLLLLLTLSGLATAQEDYADPADFADPDGVFLDVDGLQTYVWVRGPEDGAPVLLMHGFGGSTYNFRYNIDALAEAGYRAIAFDRPPFGLTAKPADYDYSHAAQAEFVAALMDELDIETASFVGHSMGGNVLAHFALRYPERVDKIMIVSGAILTGGAPGAVGDLLESPLLSGLVSEAVRTFITPESLIESLESAYADTDLLTSEARERLTAPLRIEGWQDGLAGLITDSGDNTLDTERLAEITAPTLLIWGEEDALVPLEDGEQLVELIPGATLITYTDVGHLPMEELPEQFNQDVLAFLTS